MLPMIIYTSNNILFVNSQYIVKKGIIRIFNDKGDVIDEKLMEGGLFFSGKLNLDDGKYLIKVITEYGELDKRISVLNNKNLSKKNK
jgi:hypothetical protein